jgi:predicted transposase YbfD/YdcC
MSLPLPSPRRRLLRSMLRKPWTRRAQHSPAVRRWLDRHGYITPHFTWRSYADTGGHPVPHNLRRNAIRLHWKLERLRHELGDVAMTVDGPYRTAAHNRAIGGALDSRHVHADGADFFAEQVDRWVRDGKARNRADVLNIAGRVFSNGGVGNETSGTLHLDARGARARFVTWQGAR